MEILVLRSIMLNPSDLDLKKLILAVLTKILHRKEWCSAVTGYNPMDFSGLRSGLKCLVVNKALDHGIN